MRVLATAGHVDHGKSTLVRALTGTDPDRLEEEHRRGLTIDLGFVWTTLDTGDEIAFVDVPGHSRFIGNMLAGLGPAPAVLFVVAADEGWCAQSEEHLAAVDALGIEDGLLAVTRRDLADPREAMQEARARIARSSLGEVPAFPVSPVTGEGLGALRRGLAVLASPAHPGGRTTRVRLWVDRAFTVKGAGTVVTGTLGAGSIGVGDEVELRGRRLRVRGLQSLERPREHVDAVTRVAVNLRGLDVHDVSRGDALLTPDAWATTRSLDVRVTPVLGGAPAPLPSHLTVHVGTLSAPARVRPLGDDLVRITLPRPAPLVADDRLVLRDPGQRRIVGGGHVLDADPPALTRRGAARVRAGALSQASGRPDLVTEVTRRGAMSRTQAIQLGLDPDQGLADPRTASSVLAHDGWLVDAGAWQRWCVGLSDTVRQRAHRHPLDPGVPLEEARQAVGLPDLPLLRRAAGQAGLEIHRGRLRVPGVERSLGHAEAGVAALEERLREHPFTAPDRPALDRLGLGHRELAAAEAMGRLLRLADDVVLLPDAPERAVTILSPLRQPFTTSEARRALGSTRRVVIPLLEHLDAAGRTKRIDAGHREVIQR